MARRLVCLLLLLCFGSFSVEVAIADVHDGDAPGLTTDGDTTAGESPASPDDGGERRNHDVVHVCHCVHAHGSLDSVGAAVSVTYAESQLTVDGAKLAPASADLAPHLRPPIA